ncbi:hypothetical protein [Devosia submarina]|uniref:hypothetical protein n=1 Tax=Devosia submarina TaxID=1173082 RepID=UPI000D350C1D|nr:hypothetical protein [Devosia submarina]
MATNNVHEGLGFVRFVLVWSSLSPVFLLWSIRGVDAVADYIWIPLCLLFFALPSAILLIIFWRSRSSKNVKTVEIETARDQREHLLTYLFAMLIPLFDANLGGMRDVVAVAFALLFVMFLFWHMRLHYMNLIFALCGYRIYTVEAKPGIGGQERQSSRMGTYVVISKRQYLPESSALTGYRLGGNVLVDEANDRSAV